MSGVPEGTPEPLAKVIADAMAEKPNGSFSANHLALRVFQAGYHLDDSRSRGSEGQPETIDRIEFNENGSLDEIVLTGMAHLEQMSNTGWFLGLYRPDGSGYRVWLQSVSSKTYVEAIHEVLPPDARRGSEGQPQPSGTGLSKLTDEWKAFADVAMEVYVACERAANQKLPARKWEINIVEIVNRAAARLSPPAAPPTMLRDNTALDEAGQSALPSNPNGERYNGDSEQQRSADLPGEEARDLSARLLQVREDSLRKRGLEQPQEHAPTAGGKADSDARQNLATSGETRTVVAGDRGAAPPNPEPSDDEMIVRNALNELSVIAGRMSNVGLDGRSKLRNEAREVRLAGHYALDRLLTVPGTPLPARPERPTIVCLCGSTRFYDAFQQANYDLTMQGKIVLSVGFYPHSSALAGHGEGVGHDSMEKVALDELHKRKIDLADEVLVLNVGGYIGSSTRSEIEHANQTGKPVTYLESASSPHSGDRT